MVVPAVTPAAPVVTDSSVAVGAVSVVFTAGGDGGSPITGYTAQCESADGGEPGVESGSGSPVSVTGLSPGKSYECRVKATNAVGDSPFSGFGPTVVVPVPGGAGGDGFVGGGGGGVGGVHRWWGRG